MSRFQYRARAQDGKIVKGTLRAGTEARAMELLRSHQLQPLEVTQAEQTSILNYTIFSSISTKDLILFFRQTASMIQAGVSIIQAIEALKKQVPGADFKKILGEVSYSVESGDSLSIAMSKHSKIFSPFMLGVVRTGEVSGRLSASLSSVADYLEQGYIFQRKVRAALTYPVFVLVVVVIVVMIMFTFVLPQLVTLFNDAAVALPWPTRVLIAITDFFQGYWVALILVVIALGVIIRSYLRTPEGKYAVSSYALRIPLISTLFQKIYLARLTSILYTLFSSEVPAIESLQLAKEAISNQVYQRILDTTIRAIKDGASISGVWQQEPYIPPMLSTMVSVGEKGGQVDQAFAQSSKYFQRDAEEMLETFSILLEPILILILAVGVAIIVAAILLPIYNLVLVL